MIDTATLVVAGFGLAAAAGAAWHLVPRPPRVDAERWLKTLLAQELRREGRDEAAVGAAVPWHPLGRWPERKVAHPGVSSLPGALLDGERELVASLADEPDEPSRWRLLWSRGAEDLVPGPDVASLDPSAWLGPDVGWDTPATALAERAERRLSLEWVLVDAPMPGAPDVAPAFARFAHVVSPEAPEAPEGAAAQIREALAARLPANVPERHLVIAVTGRAVLPLLRALHEDLAARDRVRAVVAVGAAVLGVPGEDGPLGEATTADWLDAHFRHLQLDTEIVRHIPWASLAWVDPEVSPPGVDGLPVRVQRWPEPGFEGREPATLEVFDLGVLPAADAPLEAVVDALRATVDLLVRTRAG